MSKIEFKPGTLMAPVPAVIVTVGDMEKHNALTIAWTGIICSDPPKTYISVRKERFSYNIIKEKKEFVINLVNKKLAVTADYCGIKSGKNTDKFEDMKINKEKGFKVEAPILTDSPLSLECKVTDIIPLGSHDMFLADIVNVDVDEKYVDENKRICLDKAMLVAYNHGEYFLLGDKIGKFGYSTMPKSVRKNIIKENNKKIK